MLICVQAPFTRTFDNKDRPWTPAVRRVAEPVMLSTTILLYNAGTTTSASSLKTDVDRVLPRPPQEGIACPRHDDRGQSPRSNPLVPPPVTPPSLCVVDYPLFLVA